MDNGSEIKAIVSWSSRGPSLSISLCDLIADQCMTSSQSSHLRQRMGVGQVSEPLNYPVSHLEEEGLLG